MCDLTLYFTDTCGQPYWPVGALVGGRRPSSPSSILCPAESGACPFRATHGIRAFSAPATSCARTLRGSCGSASCQRADPSTHTADMAKARNVPRNIITKRGGNDFFSRTFAGSTPFPLNVSFASCTFPIYYYSLSI